MLVPKQFPQKYKFYYFDLRMRTGTVLLSDENLGCSSVDASSSSFSENKSLLKASPVLEGFTPKVSEK